MVWNFLKSTAEQVFVEELQIPAPGSSIFAETEFLAVALTMEWISVITNSTWWGGVKAVKALRTAMMSG